MATATAMATAVAFVPSTATNPNANTATANAPGGSARATFMRTAMAALMTRSRDLALSLQLHRDIIVDGWMDRIQDLAEQYAEDKRQVRAHARRFKHAVADRLESARIRREQDGVSFPQFARLPAEIRLQIWEEAIPSSRAVMLCSPYKTSDKLRQGLRALPRIGRKLRRGASRTTATATTTTTTTTTTTAVTANDNALSAEAANGSGCRHLGWRSSTPVPALLHVCSESRGVALKHYSLVFACEDGRACIYADLSRDVVCLSSREVGGRCNALWRRTADLGEVRHLAVAAPACWGSWSSHYGSGFAHRLPPADLMGATGFVALEDVVMVRSIRWQRGRLPRAARLDYKAWARREEADEGLSRYYTRWQNGVMAIRNGRRKSSDQMDEQAQPEEQQGQQDAGQQAHADQDQ